jgi:pimeloyl-ACP methyl ester carboxylesterase
MREWSLTKTYRSAGGEVRWDRLGDPAQKPVVLLHGTPFSSFIWRDVARALARTSHVLVWDMPGYGASQGPTQDLSLSTMARTFAELLDHWNLAEPSVVAHDSGGAIALGAHLTHGVHYRNLALVDAVALAPWGSPFFELAGRCIDSLARLPAALHEPLMRAYVQTASSAGLRPQVLDRLVEPWLGSHGQARFYHQLAQRAGDQHYIDQLQERYEAIDIPVDIYWGDDDGWIPVDRGRELAARVHDARLEVISGAGHLAPADSPAELTAALLGFLQA